MSQTALEIILGSGFAMVAVGLLVFKNRLSKSKYYRALTSVIALLFLGFALYLAYRSFY